jgi:endonuclease YncB( thermonuclease family)
MIYNSKEVIMARVNNKIRNIFRKQIKAGSLLTLTILSASVLTACNLSFKRTELISDKLPQSTQDINIIVNDESSLDEKNLSQTIDTILNEAETIAKEADTEFIKASIVRVVDGDTLVVDIDNEEVKVRLIGIDTPESVASKDYLQKTGKTNSKEGKDATAVTKSILSDYTDVYLQKDISETDKYGRLLRYIWLSVPEDEFNINEISTKMLNAMLLEKGTAKAVSYKPDVKYQDIFEDLER